MSTNNSKYSWLKGAQTVGSIRKKSHDQRGLDSKRNYSSFWMDDDKDTRFGVKHSANSDTVKLVKLQSYRKAVTNFVKIVTKQEIPVLWYGDTSFTDGKGITLSTGIKDSNFDVTVGLALHEASHIKLTNFELVQAVYGHPDTAIRTKYRELLIIRDAAFNKAQSKGLYDHADRLKGLHNWIEDRRIDHYVFSTSPGYRAYYHKLYDEYWNSAEVARGIVSAKYADPTNFESYEFHIYNMINPLFNAKVMPGLEKIAKLINLHNIQRLKSTEDTFKLTVEVFHTILDQMQDASSSKGADPHQQSGGQGSGDQEEQQQPTGSKTDPNSKQEKGKQPKGENKKNAEQADGGADGDEQEEGEQGEQTNGGDGQQKEGDEGDQQQSEGNGDGDRSEADGGDDEESEVNELVKLDSSSAAEVAANMVLRKQRDFLKGNSTKKRATKVLQKELERIAAQDIEIESSNFLGKTRPVLNLNYTNEVKLGSLFDKLDQVGEDIPYTDRITISKILTANHYFGADPIDFPTSYSRQQKEVSTGLELGALLGRKLQVHNDVRTTVINRLRSGKIDNRRLAHAGYGIESVFNQITVNQCKPAHVHISIDGSGSMVGSCWNNTVKMVVAIAKAVKYTQNIDLRVSIRSTRGGTPCNIICYDSNINSLNHLCRLLTHFYPSSDTPEGLCYEGMLKSNLLKPSDSSVDSYLINISDGMPQGYHNYCGPAAFQHTHRMVQKMINELNMQVLSYFVSTPSSYDEPGQIRKPSADFVKMYGKTAEAIDANSVIQIARTMNKLFLSSRV